MNKHNCRICGLYIEDFPWGKDDDCPTYEICPCCGVEFGNEDYTLDSIRIYRKKWISNGGKWFSPREKPSNWNMENQLQHIPKEFI